MSWLHSNGHRHNKKQGKIICILTGEIFRLEKNAVNCYTVVT